MYSRSDSMTLTVQRESFAFSGRSTEPEVFTFERVPLQATAVRSCVPVRPKKRCIRVMYPAKVRMHLPPPERSQAKRWLVILCLVVLWQIYTEEPCADAPLSAAESSISDYRGFPFPSAAEEEAARLPELSGVCERDAASAERTIQSLQSLKPAQDAEPAGTFEQSASKSMVALLVYHRLGQDD